MVLDLGRLPTEYPLAFAPQVGRFYDVQWAAHLVYYFVHVVLGLEWLILINAALVTIPVGFVLLAAWCATRHAGASLSAALLTTLLAATSFQPRAQVLAFALFAASLYVGGSWSWSPRSRLLALAVIQVAWANVHGSFFLGPLTTLVGLVGAIPDYWRSALGREALGSDRLYFLSGALVVQLVASLCTPYGADIVRYAREVVFDPTVRGYVEEYLPPTLGTLTGALFYGAVGIAAVLMLVTWRRLRVSEALFVAGFTLFGMLAVRNVVWWGIAVAPLLAVWLARAGERTRRALPEPPGIAAQPGRYDSRGKRVIDGAFIALLLAIVFSLLPWVKPHNPLLAAPDRQLVSSEEPERATVFLRTANLGSRLFTAQVWGAYASWELWPHYSVMVGTLIEIHPPGVWADYLAITQGSDVWRERLDLYGVETLMLSVSEQQRLLRRVRADTGWREVYADDQSAVFGRVRER
jgi:hypothetical protein